MQSTNLHVVTTVLPLSANKHKGNSKKNQQHSYKQIQKYKRPFLPLINDNPKLACGKIIKVGSLDVLIVAQSISFHKKPAHEVRVAKPLWYNPVRND